MVGLKQLRPDFLVQLSSSIGLGKIQKESRKYFALLEQLYVLLFLGVARHREAGGGYVPVDWQAEVSACTRGDVRFFEYNGSDAKGVKIINLQ